MIRHADPARDAAACAALYAPFVEETAASFEDMPPTAAELAERMASIAERLPNDASLALHKALGFEHVGTYRSIGWKAGAWRDVSWWQLRLLPEADGDGPPDEPLDPQRLVDD